MNNFDHNVIDDAIPFEFRQQVWEYLQDQLWYGYTRVDQKIHRFIPRKQGFDYPESIPRATEEGTMMSRTLFARDEPELEKEHPIIHKLWEQINAQYNNIYELTGPGEDAPTIPPTNDQSKIAGLGPGWRCYTNGISSERVKRSHGVHRDCINLDDTTSRTILYVANINWLPTWMAEIVFYGEDPEGLTGDHQQDQVRVGGHTQRRGFKVGWPSAIVPAVPGRIVSYDGRTLHTTKPTSCWAPEMRVTIAFRARLKSVL